MGPEEARKMQADYIIIGAGSAGRDSWNAIARVGFEV